jgi:hypothetical protein
MTLFMGGMVFGWLLLALGVASYLWFFVDDTADDSYYAQRDRLKSTDKKVS